ncbi:MAG: hypothetical protein SGI77_21520 [Pirellulaceae bacterium]|nr:hypothetical protein [Pirellulaceae bacterium]
MATIRNLLSPPLLFLVLFGLLKPVDGQDAKVPSLENKPIPVNPPTPESKGPTPISPRSNATRAGNVTLPTTAGQYWMEYDIRPYTQALKSVDRPQQAIIDWILRDTGTDVWFNEPTGILTADRTTLRVYHNDGMHQIVKQVYERFVNGTLDPQMYSLRIVTIANPNWRQRSLAWMRSVEVESQGVQGWLLNKENSAMLMAMLRSRTDVQETQMPDLSMTNGQSHSIDQLRSKNYVREYARQEQPYPAYVPVSAEIKEGYRLQFSPLLSTDLKSLDVYLKCSIDQVEKLNNVVVELPTAFGGLQNAQIDVPQLVSWRLQERFRWPSDHVLVLSCGVIAAPTATTDGTLLGSTARSGGFLGLGKLLPPTAGPRADALLMIEYKGNASTYLPAHPNAAAGPIATNPNSNSTISRGRY